MIKLLEPDFLLNFKSYPESSGCYKFRKELFIVHNYLLYMDILSDIRKPNIFVIFFNIDPIPPFQGFHFFLRYYLYIFFIYHNFLIFSYTAK